MPVFGARADSAVHAGQGIGEVLDEGRHAQRHAPGRLGPVGGLPGRVRDLCSVGSFGGLGGMTSENIEVPRSALRTERIWLVARRHWLTFAFALGAVAWMIAQYPHRAWYFADEWFFITRTSPGRLDLPSVFEPWNGHLNLVSYLTYALQQRVFNLSNAFIVYGAFIASLVAIQLTTAAIMRRLGVPLILALTTGTLLAFFPAGAENVVSQFQLGPNLAVAALLGAMLIVISSEAGSARHAVGVTALMMLALIADSGMLVFGLVGVAIIAFALWRWQVAAWSVAPSLAAIVAWSVLSGSVPLDEWQTPIGDIPRWVIHLFALTAAGLVGAVDNSMAIDTALRGQVARLGDWAPQETLGLIVLILTLVVVGFGFVRRAYTRPVIAVLLGCLTSTLIFASLVARTRAVLLGTPYALAGVRYVHTLATFLVVALMPAIAATARSLIPSSRGRAIATSAAVAAIALVIVISAPQLARTRRLQLAWANGVRQTVGEEVWLIRRGCPNGNLNVDADPGLRLWLSQTPVGMIRTLDDAGKLPSEISRPPSLDVVIDVCRPASS